LLVIAGCYCRLKPSVAVCLFAVASLAVVAPCLLYTGAYCFEKHMRRHAECNVCCTVAGYATMMKARLFQ
jgi:hypothetical protein